MAGTQFVIPNRTQPFLLPPALQDWLPENDLSYFVLDAVEQMDLRLLYAACRSDDCQCRKAYDPAMMFALRNLGAASGVWFAHSAPRGTRSRKS